MPLIAMLLFSVTAIGNNIVSASPIVTVYATDYIIETELDKVCTKFNVTVGIDDVVDMGAWGFQLDYNTSQINCTRIWSTPDTANCTDWVPTDGLGVFHWDGPPTINRTIGRVDAGALNPQPLGGGLTGDFELVKVGFHIILAPPSVPNENHTLTCALDLHDVVIGDSYGDPITVDVLDDGVYSYTRIGPIPGEPVANFVYNPLFPYVCDTVTLTDTSTPNGGVIIAWLWVITGPGTLTGPNNVEETTFHCDGPGDVNVTLTVWDSEGMNDTVSKLIPQKEKLGCILDLYTSHNRWCGQWTPFVGAGPNVPADSLSPDVNVTLFANVSWNGAPRNHVLVAFEVLDNKNACVLYRTAESNKDGTARIWFRIPTPCDESLFGKWYVIATAKIQDVKQNDTMRFDVGYPITLIQEELILDDDTYLVWCDYIYATVLVKNIMFIEKEVTIVAVAYDDCDVPIGQVIVKDVLVPGGSYCHPYYLPVPLPGIHVPQWTYVGVGKLYVSAFTRLPRLCGVAYCPEVSAQFLLEWRGPP